MANSFLLQLLSPTLELANPSPVLLKSSFLSNSKLLFVPNSRNTKLGQSRFYKPPSASAKSFNHIPKQFREENLKDGLMDNYKRVPSHLYGLNPSQLDMFMTEDNPFRRQSEKVTEESISSSRHYMENGGMYSLSGMTDMGPAKYSMSVSMYRGGGRGGRRPRRAPPDLPSLLLDSRIVFLGMPIVPAVTELLIAQFMFLDEDDMTKPIYLYVNSPGTQNENREIVGSETDAYTIADAMNLVKAPVYTVNLGMAYGQAALLLSLGAKGKRALQPNSSTKLYLPKVPKSSGSSSDMWIKAKELDANTNYFLELLALGTGKTMEELREDLQFPMYLPPQKAIDYGLADRIYNPSKPEDAFFKRDKKELLARAKAMREAKAGSRAAAQPDPNRWTKGNPYL